jgi:hypothetical protein
MNFRHYKFQKIPNWQPELLLVQELQRKLREMPLLNNSSLVELYLRAFRASICRPGSFKTKPKYKFYPINQVTLNSNSIQNTVHKFTDLLKELYLSMQEHLVITWNTESPGAKFFKFLSEMAVELVLITLDLSF